jgi:hypothetical protein
VSVVLEEQHREQEEVSSYAKQMMELAAEWVKVNPDPGSGFINVPGLEETRKKRTDLIREKQINALKEKVKDPRIPEKLRKEIEQNLADMDENLEKLIQMTSEQIDLEAEAQALFNEVPTPGQSKNPTEDALRADRGRWCLAWARHGHNVFDLSPDFTAAMLLTDPTEVDIKTAKLPFKGLLITIPAGFATGVEGLHYTKIHVWEMPRTHIEQLDVSHKIVDIMKSVPDADYKSLLNTAVERVNAKTPKTLLTPKIDENDYAICIYATDGAHAFNTLIESKHLSWAAIDELPDNVTEEADRQARRTIQQIVFGMLAYVNAVEGATTPREPVEKKASKKKKTSGESRLKHWEVGRTIRLDPKLVAAARGGSREIALKIKTRFIVRGHYRNVAHGPKRSLHTMKWISPFWKGPEEGARIVHTYKLDNPPEQTE